MIQPSGAIPSRACVGFHVAVVNEHLAHAIEGEVVCVAEPTSNEFDGFAFQVRSQHNTARSFDFVCVSARIFVARQ